MSVPASGPVAAGTAPAAGSCGAEPVDGSCGAGVSSCAQPQTASANNRMVEQQMYLLDLFISVLRDDNRVSGFQQNVLLRGLSLEQTLVIHRIPVLLAALIAENVNFAQIRKLR